MRRTLALVAAALALACRPAPLPPPDAGCQPPTFALSADGGAGDAGAAGCTPWDGGVGDGGCSGTDLDTALLANVTAAESCQTDQDCVVATGEYLPGSCYVQPVSVAIAASQAQSFAQAQAGLVCGFCQACYPNGQLASGNPPAAAGSCSQVNCLQGRCVVSSF